MIRIAPAKPMNRPACSRSPGAEPVRNEAAIAEAGPAALSAPVRSRGKWAITAGSALSVAKGAVSAGRQRRRSRSPSRSGARHR